MPILYAIYANDGQGGPVDYATPIATTTALTFTTTALAAPSDNTFAVRATDVDSGLEEANTVARVRIILDARGNDVSSRPNPPHALFVRATAGGGLRATWGYSAAGQAAPPTEFLVFLTPGASASFASPAATVAYTPGLAGYSCEFSGLVDGAAYTIAVRASNADATETNTGVVATVVADATPPSDVDSLQATPTFVDY